MGIPNLKRVKVSSEQELRAWLNKQPDEDQSVMLVTYTKTSRDKHVSHEQVHEALVEHGWASGRKYTLNSHLLGHLISKHQDEPAMPSFLSS